MLSTRSASGGDLRRPMSNNHQVDYDGDNYFFTCDHHGSVRDIENDPNVGLGFQAKSGALHMKPYFHRDRRQGRADPRQGRVRSALDQDIEAWFKEGIDTPGLTLIKVPRHPPPLLGRLRLPAKSWWKIRNANWRARRRRAPFSPVGASAVSRCRIALATVSGGLRLWGLRPERREHAFGSASRPDRRCARECVRYDPSRRRMTRAGFPAPLWTRHSRPRRRAARRQPTK